MDIHLYAWNTYAYALLCFSLSLFIVNDEMAKNILSRIVYKSNLRGKDL